MRFKRARNQGLSDRKYQQSADPSIQRLLNRLKGDRHNGLLKQDMCFV